MLFKDFVNSVLMEMGEYSNSGSLISESENKDYLLAITRLTNDSMVSVATLGKTNTKNQNISHLMPENQLGFSEWNEELFHNDTDIIFSAVGSRYYSFQVGSAATIYIEEDIAGVWTNITTINHVPTVSGYQTLYGTITPSNIANTIRLRFSGAYYYPLRWIALFKENLSTTVKYEPYVPYSTPVDFYVLDSVDFLHANRQYESYGDYKFNNATKEILFGWYTKGEFRLTYSAYPTQLTISTTDVHAADNETIDLPNEFISSLKFDVCGKLKAAIDNKYGEADRFQSMYIDNLNEAIKNKQSNVGFEKIQSLSGW